MLDLEESYVKRAMIANAAEVVAVSSADKLGSAGPYVVGSLGELTQLVTERPWPPGPRPVPRARRRDRPGLMRRAASRSALFFFGDGLLIGSWAARIPAVQQHASLTNARLGLALFAASLGALVAMPLAGRLCERIGSRPVTLAALLLGSGSLFAASLATGLAGLAAALFGFGAGFGAINVSANAQGLALERLSRPPDALLLPRRVLGRRPRRRRARRARRRRCELGPRAHFAVVATALARDRPRGGRGSCSRPRPTTRPKSRTFARPPRAIVVLGAAAFCTMLAEGAAADWSAVYLSHSFGAAASRRSARPTPPSRWR